ncbi:MAG TPA: UDP-N-acetylglucosamine 1-carboxyvinyltransferase [Rhodothermales bacterium]|nr:UDP-N-acetylglucosamine 1-carboxyvinyltransferase [Rhodothermales bacterium]
MEKLVIEGPGTLKGSLPVSGSKNTALMLMAGAMLAEGRSRIRNVPRLRDISTFSQVLRVAGAEVVLSDDEPAVDIDASNITSYEAPYELVKKMRASFYMLGALLGRFGRARVSLPGGCAWGPRPVDLHLKGMEALGAEITLDEGYVVARAPGGRLNGGRFRFEKSTVGATANLMLAASLAKGTTHLDNVAIEPDVIELGNALRKMGAKVEGLGSHSIEIEGVDRLEPAVIENCPDRIELGTFLIAAAISGRPGDRVAVTGGRADHLGETFLTALTDTGTGIEVGDDTIFVTPSERLRPVSIVTGVYPGFPTDLQAQWVILLTQAEGDATVRDPIYPDRFAHIPELVRLGAKASVDGDTVSIKGRTRLTGAQVMSTDLRASVSLVLAGMVAGGTTEVLRIYHLDRGYEQIELKLRDAGIDIRREPYDEFAQPVPHII